MNKAALIEIIANKASVSKKQAEVMIETLVDTIISEIKKGNEVTITGFGTFLSRTRHARGGVNPQNPSERIQIPEVKVAKFRTGKRLKDALKGKIETPDIEVPEVEEVKETEEVEEVKAPTSEKSNNDSNEEREETTM